MKIYKLVACPGIAVALSIISATAAQASALTASDMFPVLAEYQSISATTQVGINPASLTLSHDAIVSVTFISEGAGYRNSFGWYNAANDPTVAANRDMIWSNASGTGSGLAGGGSLDSGETVSLGSFAAGSEFGFFLSANGFNNPNAHTYFTNDALNPDGISHVVAGILPEQGLLAIGWEDLWGGGDRDYNDLIIAIDIGVENATALAAGAPEPSVWALMLMGMLMMFWYFRRLSERGLLKPSQRQEPVESSVLLC